MKTKPGFIRRSNIRQLWIIAATAFLVMSSSCARAPRHERPNVLWVVWDTVRSDRMSLYGHERPTTPFLDEWSRNARVFDNCLSVASTTVPAHVSMFTGLMPGEHRTDNIDCFLSDEFEMLGEIFQRNGYQTWIYSENPLISGETGFAQGFDSLAHPWDRRYRAKTKEILRDKLPARFRNRKLPGLPAGKAPKAWLMTDCGELGEWIVEKWFENREKNRPFFLFLNYMEAHQPIVTPERYRLRMMQPEQVDESYYIDMSWLSVWRYTFGLSEYVLRQQEIIGRVYDASVVELDELFHNLLATLEAEQLLDNTIVILTSDHGEHLFEHHMLEHQYSLYQPLLKVPLVIYYPPRVAPGRDHRPVTNLDIYPTLLELTGLEGMRPGSLFVSLLAPLEERERYAAFLTPPMGPIKEVKRNHPDWDSTPYLRSLQSIQTEQYKLIWGSDDRHELYDLVADPGESINLFESKSTVAANLLERLVEFREAMSLREGASKRPARLSNRQKELLRSLGYLGE